MLLDDSLQHFRRDVVVPDAFRIDDGDGTLLADPQAVRLGAIDAMLPRQQAQIRKSLFQIIPGKDGGISGGTMRLGLVRAKENVAADPPNLQVGCDLSQTL